MRRPIKQRPLRPEHPHTHMSRDLDWLVDQWREARPEDRVNLVLAKIRAEEKIREESRIH